MGIREVIKEKILIFDGAMGTMLQSNGLVAGELPEIYNITQSELVEKIHREYAESGADIVTTNTFGANELKLENSGYTVEEIITAGVKIAKAGVGPGKYVALDIGPIGQLMLPIGNLSFEAAYEIFKRQIIAGDQAGADCILIETISDVYEAKAAIIAAKENSNLPVICTMTFQENGRSLMGTDPVTMVNILQDLGIDAIGLNCSLGPNALLGIAKEILRYAKVPVIVQANAGLPRIEGNQTIYDLTVDEYVKDVMAMVEAGVSIVGGCCGTTPEYIEKMREKTSGLKPLKIAKKSCSAVSSATRTVFLGERIQVIGERINPTGKKKLKEALKAGNMGYVIEEAVKQVEAGASILDVNVGLPEIDEEATMKKIIEELDGIVSVPLQIDSSNPKVVEAAVRLYNGKTIINSVNGKQSSMDAIFPIAKKYGACVIALTLDERGLPKNEDERFEIAEKIIKTAKTYGIDEERIIVDCLTLTASAQQEAGIDTLKAIQKIKSKYNVRATLGVSNISFGLPSRKELNKVFLTMAMTYGLDTPITDPTEKEIMATIKSFEVLTNKDKEAKDYIEYFSGNEMISNETKKLPVSNVMAQMTLKEIIIKGFKDEVQIKTKTLLEEKKALEVVNEVLIPALEVVGQKYEKGEIFLPQLIKSAETVKKAFDVIKEQIKAEGSGDIYYGEIVLATVKGDIHDIGKNIVKVLLENYGYKVIDLGKDVPIELVVETVKKHNIKMVGLSALMTTTVANMKETIEALRKADLDCKVMVGGAVLNEEYSKLMGADYYCKDAMESVKVVNKFFK